MSEQPLTIEKPKRSLKHKAMKAGAVVFSGLALGAAGAPAANAENEGRHRLPDQEEIQPGLRNIEELSGYKINVGPEMRNRLQSSTVEIVKRLKHIQNEDGSITDYPWIVNCTGLKVNLPGNKTPYIMSASHCFPEVTNSDYDGLFTHPLAPFEKAQNFINLETYELGIVDPQDPLEDRLRQPLIKVDGLVLSTNNKDLALLRPAPPAQKGGLPIGRDFYNIPAVELHISEAAPVPGEQIALYGLPAASEHKPVVGTGRYIGRIRTRVENSKGDNSKDINVAYRLQDVVVINPNTPAEDTCNYGASGSLAMRANGKVLGPLTGRINGGYGAAKEMQEVAASLGETPELAESWRNYLQERLKVEISNYSTICFFTVLDKQTPLNLINGFNTIAPPLPPVNPHTTEGKG